MIARRAGFVNTLVGAERRQITAYHEIVARERRAEDTAREGVTVPRDGCVLRRYLTSLRDVVSLVSEPGAGILPKDGPAQERVPALYTRPVSFPRFKTEEAVA